MKTLFALLLVILGWSMRSNAIETDQFAAWGVELRDSSEELEFFLVSSILSSLSRVNFLEGPSAGECSDVVQWISDDLSKMSTPFVTTIEHWLMNSDKIDTHSIANSNWESIEKSIYNGYWRFKVLPFASTVNLYGVYLGVDKIGHFVEIGQGYYQKHLIAYTESKNHVDAQKVAIDHGVFLEDTIYGTMAAKIFSYGDMEANFQGMKWYQSLCTQGKHAHLQLTEDSKWILKNKEKFSIREYINPFWDESYYLNYFTVDMWDRVKTDLLYKCIELEDERVQSRFSLYKKYSKSKNLEYLENLEKNERIPKRDFKYFEDYCYEAK